MKALIVFAHPKKESFTHTLVNRITKTLEETGNEVVIRDLYAMDFDPVLAAEDMVYVDGDKFVRDQPVFPEEVQQEQRLIEVSDLLIYIFPIWWNGMPAMMKGYVDRVFQHDFAYSFTSDEPKKRFGSKKVLFFSPTGQPQNEDGTDTPLNKVIKATTSDWMFSSNGADVVNHTFYGRVPYLSQKDLEKYLQDAQRQIEELNT